MKQLFVAILCIAISPRMEGFLHKSRHSKQPLIVHLAYMCLKAMKRADTKPSIEGRRLDAPLPTDLKVAACTVGVPGDVMFKLVPVLTAANFASKLAALELAATVVLRVAEVITEVSTFSVNVTAAARRATEDVILMPVLYVLKGDVVVIVHHVGIVVAAPFSTVFVYAHSILPLVLPV